MTQVPHVSPGDRFRGIRSRHWNAFADAANAHSHQQLIPGPARPVERELITIRNDSTSDAGEFRALAIADDPVIVEDTSGPHRTIEAHEVFWKGEKYVDKDAHVILSKRWCIPVGPIAKDRAGLAVYTGITPAKVTIRDEQHTHVELDPENANKLRSSMAGYARILHRRDTTDDTTPVEDVLCIVEIGTWSPTVIYGQVKETIDPPTIDTENNDTLTIGSGKVDVYYFDDSGVRIDAGQEETIFNDWEDVTIPEDYTIKADWNGKRWLLTQASCNETGATLA